MAQNIGINMELTLENNTRSSYTVNNRFFRGIINITQINQMNNQILHNALFPHLTNDKWIETNLNDVALKYKDNPILNKLNELHWIQNLHKIINADHSWGGWMEHRNYLLRNHYHKDIGIDHF